MLNPFTASGYAILRYGIPGSREVRVQLDS